MLRAAEPPTLASSDKAVSATEAAPTIAAATLTRIQMQTQTQERLRERIRMRLAAEAHRPRATDPSHDALLVRVQVRADHAARERRAAHRLRSHPPHARPASARGSSPIRRVRSTSRRRGTATKPAPSSHPSHPELPPPPAQPAIPSAQPLPEEPSEPEPTHAAVDRDPDFQRSLAETHAAVRRARQHLAALAVLPSP